MRPRLRHNVFTRNPTPPAPSLACPICQVRLSYVDTALSGVTVAERYDRFTRTMHGPFEYRHRTRRLRPVVAG
jgi:hypothetical protein